jgi:hypothetical protein
VIHGDHYFLQEEWSNDDASCRPRDEADRVSFPAPARPRPGVPLTFTARAHDPDGSILYYNWFFGDRHLARTRRSQHTFRRPGTYRVVLRITDRSGNWGFYARELRVAEATRPARAR